MDIICYSHLRWNFVYQRPQHLLSRMAKQFRVFFIEEPVFDTETPFLDTSQNADKVWVVVPHLPAGLDIDAIENTQVNLLKDLFDYCDIQHAIAWFYTPMALGLAKAIDPELVIYDCMDELSAFKNAPPSLKLKEKELLAKADLVFTGGRSLYEAKIGHHPDLHCFPSSIDKKHFEKARVSNGDIYDQQNIPHPRIGFFGVIDERMDLDLLATVAARKPEWHFVMIGPTVKIDPTILPGAENIHYLGGKNYKELPNYIAEWDVAMMPFAINEATRFISPTKTPEYLAAGKPVVSTPIHDVVKDYGQTNFVFIASTPDEFIDKIQSALSIEDRSAWLKQVDTLLAKNSWDQTTDKMIDLIHNRLNRSQHSTKEKKERAYV